MPPRIKKAVAPLISLNPDPSPKARPRNGAASKGRRRGWHARHVFWQDQREGAVGALDGWSPRPGPTTFLEVTGRAATSPPGFVVAAHGPESAARTRADAARAAAGARGPGCCGAGHVCEGTSQRVRPVVAPRKAARGPMCSCGDACSKCGRLGDFCRLGLLDWTIEPPKHYKVGNKAALAAEPGWGLPRDWKCDEGTQ